MSNTLPAVFELQEACQINADKLGGPHSTESPQTFPRGRGTIWMREVRPTYLKVRPKFSARTR